MLQGSERLLNRSLIDVINYFIQRKVYEKVIYGCYWSDAGCCSR